jgi:ubiquinone/menaquinone biosynthesis C-methylase UbiE
MLTRVFEPEVMDSSEDAREYDAMDHAAVNAQFVSDLLAVLEKGDWSNYRAPREEFSNNREPIIGPVPFFRVLDLGTGTAQIPIELCRHAPRVHVTAVDAAESMLALARNNVAAAGLADRIQLVRSDAKCLAATRSPSGAERVLERAFDAVISNSIVHHIAEPRAVIATAIRLTAPGGLLFHRDLARPCDEAQLNHLVATYAGDATPYQRKLFGDSLRATLTVDEMRELVTEFGFAPDTVQMTSDRHWTWSARR